MADETNISAGPVRSVDQNGKPNKSGARATGSEIEQIQDPVSRFGVPNPVDPVSDLKHRLSLWGKCLGSSSTAVADARRS